MKSWAILPVRPGIHHCRSEFARLAKGLGYGSLPGSIVLCSLDPLFHAQYNEVRLIHIG